MRINENEIKQKHHREIERVGGTKTISLDIRIIAATNRNLEEMVKEWQFREDRTHIPHPRCVVF